MSTLIAAVSAGIAGASPDRLAAALSDVLAAETGATLVELHVIDYQQGVLLNVADGSQCRVDEGSVLGRAYASQVANVDRRGAAGTLIHLPVSARGDRLGVLRVSLPAETDAAVLESVLDLELMIGDALAVALRLTDTYERVRRAQSLTLAAEMQWQLLPARSYADKRVAVAGQLEPAYSIAGDTFDWSLEGDRLWVAALDGNGRGVTATLATTVTITALRNARRSGASLSDQASLADQALYAQFGGEQFVSALLCEFDLRARTLRAVDAGSPQLLRVRGGKVEHRELEAQLPLGMFEETVYREQFDEIEAEDRYVIVSDGVHAARSPRGDEFGGAALERVVQLARLLAAPEAVRHVARGLRDHRVSDRADDDAVVVWIDLDPARVGLRTD